MVDIEMLEKEMERQNVADADMVKAIKKTLALGIDARLHLILCR